MTCRQNFGGKERKIDAKKTEKTNSVMQKLHTTI